MQPSDTPPAAAAPPRLSAALPEGLVDGAIEPAIFHLTEAIPAGRVRVPFVSSRALNTCAMPCTTPRKPLSRCFGPPPRRP